MTRKVLFIMDDIIESLKDLGLNSYEAKVYVALLKKYPATGYEVAKIADIPQSRAYDTLKSLENSKIVTSSTDKPQTFTPIKPKELTKRYRRKIESNLDFLEKKLPDVKSDYNEPILPVLNSGEIREKMIEIIKSAKHDIYIEIWSADFKYIEQHLFDAYNRGLDIKIVGYDNFNYNFGTVYKHKNGREIERSLGGRMIFMNADDKEGLFGNIDKKVIWTKNPEVIFLLKEFIVHDMYLLDIEESFPEQLKYFYGNGLKRLKEKILSQNSKFIIH